MHDAFSPTPPPVRDTDITDAPAGKPGSVHEIQGPWYRLLTSYHWFVLFVVAARLAVRSVAWTSSSSSWARVPAPRRAAARRRRVGEFLRRPGHGHLHRRLGHRRPDLRRPRRPHRPRPRHDVDHPHLLRLHRSDGLFRQRLGLRPLPLPHRNGRRRRVRRRRRAGRRGHAGSRPAVRPGPVTGALGDRQRLRRPYQHGPRLPGPDRPARRYRRPVATHVRYRHDPGPVGAADPRPTQGAGTLAAHRRGRRNRQTRQHGRTLLRPALAAQRPGRLRPCLFRRHRLVGHRLFQLRPHRQNP